MQSYLLLYSFHSSSSDGIVILLADNISMQKLNADSLHFRSSSLIAFLIGWNVFFQTNVLSCLFVDNFCEENDFGFTLFDKELESFVCASKQSSVCVTTLFPL